MMSRPENLPDHATWSEERGLWRVEYKLDTTLKVTWYDSGSVKRSQEYLLGDQVCERWSFYANGALLCFASYDKGVASALSFFIEPDRAEWQWELERFCACRVSKVPQGAREIRLVPGSAPLRYEYFGEGGERLDGSHDATGFEPTHAEDVLARQVLSWRAPEMLDDFAAMIEQSVHMNRINDVAMGKLISMLLDESQPVEVAERLALAIAKFWTPSVQAVELIGRPDFSAKVLEVLHRFNHDVRELRMQDQNARDDAFGELFGELRALLAVHHAGGEVGLEILELAERARALNIDRFECAWRPHMDEFFSTQREPIQVKSLAEKTRWQRLGGLSRVELLEQAQEMTLYPVDSDQGQTILRQSMESLEMDHTDDWFDIDLIHAILFCPHGLCVKGNLDVAWLQAHANAGSGQEHIIIVEGDLEVTSTLHMADDFVASTKGDAFHLMVRGDVSARSLLRNGDSSMIVGGDVRIEQVAYLGEDPHGTETINGVLVARYVVGGIYESRQKGELVIDDAVLSEIKRRLIDSSVSGFIRPDVCDPDSLYLLEQQLTAWLEQGAQPFLVDPIDFRHALALLAEGTSEHMRMGMAQLEALGASAYVDYWGAPGPGALHALIVGALTRLDTDAVTHDVAKRLVELGADPYLELQGCPSPYSMALEAGLDGLCELFDATQSTV